MAQTANTWETYDTVGIREDLEDMAYNISPTERPFTMAAGKTKAKSTLHEWLTDSLAAAVATNKNAEGDAATNDASTPAVRRTNYTQIADKVAEVSDTNEAVDAADDQASMVKQISKRTKELMRDIESQLLSNQAKNVGAGDGATARVSASVLSWLKTNTDKSAAGSPADPSAADGTGTRTDGTQRVFTEAQLNSVQQKIWTAGGEPGLIMVGGFNKQQFSKFTGNATKTVEAATGKLVASVDVYKGDFGTQKIVANRFMRSRDCLVLDMDYWKVAWLRPVKTWPLAKNGDSDRQQVLGEYTLVSCNEAASGIVADLTTS